MVDLCVSVGGGGRGAAAVADSDSQYVSAKTCVWWDIENCQVPRGCDPHAIAQNISKALANMNYSGTVSVSAYGDTNRIPSSVQQALSSTGIALNHVPAGVKDASDKKILVDMLFWAVDNPAPANYLLISGDRDFSNALHQLRMRRYNILLAQPLKASAALVAAAASVWRWTTLVAGGSPLTSSELANGTNMSRSETSQSSLSGTISIDQSSYSRANISAFDHKFVNPGRVADPKFKVKFVPRNPNQFNVFRLSSMPSEIHSNTNIHYSQPPESAGEKQFKKAPHEFFGPSPNAVTSSSAPDLFPGNDDPPANSGNNMRNQFTQPQPALHPENLLPPSSHNNAFVPFPPRIDVPKNAAISLSSPADIAMMNISMHASYSENANNFTEQSGKELISNFTESPSTAGSHGAHSGNTLHSCQPIYSNSLHNKYNHHPDFTPPTSSMATKCISSNSVWGNQGCQPPSEYVLGPIGVILLALNTLKIEKLMPSEANIVNCIRYGNPKHRNVDVRKALDYALEQQMIVKQNLGDVQLYVGRLERLWKCINPTGGSTKQYPKVVWDMIQNFLISSAGRSAIMASESRYEAALIFKNSCLKELALGEVLQVLDMIISMKKWITLPQSGWQPIAITFAEPCNKNDNGACH